MRKFRLLLPIVVLAVALFCLSACGTIPPVTDDPNPVNSVESVTIKYQDTLVISGSIAADKSLGTIQLDADVKTTGAPEYTLTFTSGNTAVASIAGKTVTLLTKGESVITAAAGGKEHKVVLTVTDTAPSTFEISVTGGSASMARAAADTLVTLTPAKPSDINKRFKNWEFDVEGLWTNGNLFRMPAQAVTVTAVYEQYEATVVDMEVTNAPDKTVYNYGDTFDPSGMIVSATTDEGETFAVSDYTYKTGSLDHGDFSFGISYKGFSKNIALNINAVVTLLELRTSPSKLQYAIGQTFNGNGLSVTATFSNGSLDNFTYGIDDGFSFAPSGALSADDDIVTVSYGGKSIEIPIKVIKLTESFALLGTDTTIYTNEGMTNSVSFDLVKTTNSSDDIEFDLNVISGAEDGIDISYDPEAEEVTINAVSSCVIEVTAKTTDGSDLSSDPITITVLTKVEEVSVNSFLLLLEEEGKLVATITPADVTDASVTWELISETTLDGSPLGEGQHVISLEADGTVTGIGAGKATVQATTTDGGLTAAGVVTVANLALVGGKVKDAEPVGTTLDEATGTTASIYLIDQGEELTLVADEAPAGKMFVGWDVGAEGYRLGEPGAAEYSFTMQNKPYRIWSVFSDYKNLFNANSWDLDKAQVAGGKLYPPNTGSNVQFGRTSDTGEGIVITNGMPAGAANADSDLEGWNGVGLGFRSNVVAGTHNRLRGSDLSNVNSKGSVTISYIFKNHSPNYDLTIELMGENYGATASTGNITIPKNSVLKKTIVVPHGMGSPPYFVIVVKSNIGGTGAAGERVLLDIVARQANTFMNFDPALPTEDVVKLSDVGFSKGAYDDDHGLIILNDDTVALWGKGRITNMPALESGKSTTTLYFRAVNYNVTTESYSCRITVGSTDGGSNLADKTITFLKNENGNDGNAQLFSIEIDRSANPSNIYIRIDAATAAASTPRCFSVQMGYSDVFILYPEINT